MYTKEHRKKYQCNSVKIRGEKIDNRGRNTIKKRQGTDSALPF